MSEEKNYKVILVEDNPIAMMSLSLFFKDQNVTVLDKLHYAEELLTSVEKNKPDALVIDVMLKGELDGIDAVKSLRKTSNVPVLFVSALSDSKSLDRVSEIPNSGYLTKPYSYEDVKNILEKLLEEEV